MLPFDEGSFDMVINRHGDFNSEEIYRVLKPGGLFITQQVGAENDWELVVLLCGPTELPFPDQYLNTTTEQFSQTGFEILEGRKCFRPIQFYDVGETGQFDSLSPDFDRKSGTKLGKTRDKNGTKNGIPCDYKCVIILA